MAYEMSGLSSPQGEPFALDPNYADAQSGAGITLRTVFDDREPDASFSIGCAALGILPLIVVAVFMLGQVLGAMALRARFDAAGVPAVGALRRCDRLYLLLTEVDLRFYYVYSAPGENGAPREYIGQASDSSDGAYFRLCEPGDRRLQVEYLPDAPGVSRVIDALYGGDRLLWLEALIGGGALLLIGIVARWAARERANVLAARAKYARLRTHGRVLTGEIVQAQNKAVGRQRENVLLVDYRFVSPTGATLSGRQRKYRLDMRSQFPPPPGTPIRVLYADDESFVAL
jgi:hypothetical protein